MLARLQNIADRLRTGLWVSPLCIVLGCTTAAVICLEADFRLNQQNVIQIAGDPSSAARLLSSVSSTVLSLTGVVFSATLVAVSLASSQFGSRLLRSFLSDCISDRLIGVLLGTFLSCHLIQLRIRPQASDNSGFVPGISVLFAVCLGILSVILLIVFVHQAVSKLHAPRVVSHVADDLDDAVREFFRLADSLPGQPCRQIPDLGEPLAVVRAAGKGVIQALDVDALLATATDHDVIIRITRRPGHFVCRHDGIAEIHAGHSGKNLDADPERLNDDISRCFVLGLNRTPRQDVAAPINEIVEIAARALSPGVNNPLAANNCIDHLGAALADMASAEFPAPCLNDEEGQLRCVIPWPDFSNLLCDAFSRIRQYAIGNVAVEIRILEALERIAGAAEAPRHLEAVIAHGRAVRETFASNDRITADLDREVFEERYARLESVVNARSASVGIDSRASEPSAC